MARSQDIRDAIAAHLGTVAFDVSVAIKNESLNFAEVDLHQFPTVYVSEMQHERETRITRVHTRKGYKIACVVAGFINEYTQEQYADVSQKVLNELEGRTMSGARQTTIADGAAINEYETAPNENRKFYESPLEIEYEEIVTAGS